MTTIETIPTPPTPSPIPSLRLTCEFWHHTDRATLVSCTITHYSRPNGETKVVVTGSARANRLAGARVPEVEA